MFVAVQDIGIDRKDTCTDEKSSLGEQIPRNPGHAGELPGWARTTTPLRVEVQRSEHFESFLVEERKVRDECVPRLEDVVDHLEPQRAADVGCLDGGAILGPDAHASETDNVIAWRGGRLQPLAVDRTRAEGFVPTIMIRSAYEAHCRENFVRAPYPLGQPM